MQNISKEDYLRTIYKFSNENGEIKANKIAGELNISNAAVTDMLKKLAKEGHIVYKKYKSIKLSEKGKSYAGEMVRRHRIWEVFLNQVVGIPWDKVHDEANNLEHSSSEELINRMEEMLDFPEFDPHGDPIPGKDGALPRQRKNVPLSKLKKGNCGIVIRVNDFDNNFLKYISGIGIKLDKEILVKDVLDFDKSMLIAINNVELNISNTIAANIFVELK